MEILHIDILVWGRLSLAPEKKTFLGRHFWGGGRKKVEIDSILTGKQAAGEGQSTTLVSARNTLP